MKETYTHGHHDSVLRSHRSRTAANSAAYLLPHLEPGLDLLDIGCGPGTITAELAELVRPGRTIGVDREPGVLAEARGRGGSATFQEGDVYRLDFAPGSFDVVHAHQALQHLADPVAALGEMYRVLRPEGYLAVRDADYGAFLWYPADPRLERWREIYTAVCRRNGAEADTGRRLPGWVAAAGFRNIEVSSSNWTYADPGSREWWSSVWAERTLESAFGRQAVEYGLATRNEMEGVAHGWHEWGARPEGLFIVVHVEVLARPS